MFEAKAGEIHLKAPIFFSERSCTGTSTDAGVPRRSTGGCRSTGTGAGAQVQVQAAQAQVGEVSDVNRNVNIVNSPVVS